MWDQNLISEGLQLLDLSAKGAELSEYHLEAAIAAVHATAPNVHDTNWDEIVSLYSKLMAMRPSPIVALNRAIAIGQRDGAERGLRELRSIANSDRLAKYPFYQAALGEFEQQLGHPQIAREYFLLAMGLSRNSAEQEFFKRRIDAAESYMPAHK